MEATPTRVRRLRTRRAVGRAASAACLAAGILLAAEVAGGAVPVGGPSPAVHLEASPARIAEPADGPAADVGIWVVEGSEAVSAAGDPAVISVGQMPVRAAHVVVKGKDHDVTTNAATVRQLLSAMGIEPGSNDRVSPPPRTPLHDGATIRVIDVSFGRARVSHPVPFGTVTRYTTSIAAGQVRRTPGSPGKAIWTVRRRYEDGRFVSRKVIKKKVVRQAVDAVRTVGTFQPEKGPTGHNARTQTGTASWYDHPGLTAASPWLALGTRVTVTNLENGRTVTVVINDRGPFGGGIIDLSKEAFAQIAPVGAGLVKVRLDW